VGTLVMLEIEMENLLVAMLWGLFLLDWPSFAKKLGIMDEEDEI
jgi:hypothetical protein